MKGSSKHLNLHTLLIRVIADEGKNWRERKVHTIELIRGAGHDMKLLSFADKLANIRDIIRDYDRLGEDVWDRFNAPKESQAWYYGSMLEAFAAGDGSIGDTVAFLEYRKCVGGFWGWWWHVISISGILPRCVVTLCKHCLCWKISPKGMIAWSEELMEHNHASAVCCSMFYEK